MFCKKCGAEINEGAAFCPKCGTAVNGEAIAKTQVIEDGEVKYQLKPKFILGYKLITNFGRGLLYFLIFTIYFFAEAEDGVNIGNVLGVFAGIFAGIMVVYILIKLIFENMQYKHYEYNFYNTKLEYIDGFLNKEEKELKYKYIREVTMSQNIIERLFGIGKIKVFTNASSGMNNGAYGNSMRNRNGIQIHCVENVNEQYKKVKELIDNGLQDE